MVATVGKYVDIFMLNYLIEDRQSLGYYGLATIFVLSLNQITATAQTIATPYFSEKSNNKEDFLRVLRKYQKLLIILATFITLIAVVFIPLFIRYFYGIDYDSVGIYFRILVLKYFFKSCYGLVGVAILGLGMMRYNFLSGSISVPISLALSYVFIKNYGVIGAAIAQALTQFISLIIASLIVKHVVKVHFRK